MQKRVLAIFLVLLLLFGISIPAVGAQTSSIVADAEAERNKQLTKELSLNIPEVTDDPNYPVTFTDPSGKGVEITIAEKTTPNAPSPFLLPNLAIGKYTVTFKFTNKEGLLRVLSKDLIISPKAPAFDPTIKTSIQRPNQAVVSGTALPQSTIMLVVNSTDTYKFSVNQEGKWEYILPAPAEGDLKIIGFVIRNGFVSEPSKVLTIEYELHQTDKNPVIITQGTDIFRQTYDNIVNFANTYPNEFYLVITVTAVIIIFIIAFSIRRKMDKRREEKSISDLFGNTKDKKTILDIVSPEKIVAEEKKMEKEAAEKVSKAAEATTVPKKETSVEKKSKQKIDISAKRYPKPEEKQALSKGKKKSVKQSPKTSEKKEKNVKLDTKQIDDEKDIETTKKILSKEEFLKQFETKKE